MSYFWRGAKTTRNIQNAESRENFLRLCKLWLIVGGIMIHCTSILTMRNISTYSSYKNNFLILSCQLKWIQVYHYNILQEPTVGENIFVSHLIKRKNEVNHLAPQKVLWTYWPIGSWVSKEALLLAHQEFWEVKKDDYKPEPRCYTLYRP